MSSTHDSPSTHAAPGTSRDRQASAGAASDGFTMDSFDFGAEFNLPSHLDELNIFNGGAGGHSGGPGSIHERGATPAGGPASSGTPSALANVSASAHAGSHDGASIGAPSPASIKGGSGRAGFNSPRLALREDVSRTGSPRTVGGGNSSSRPRSGSSSAGIGPHTSLASLLLSLGGGGNNAAGGHAGVPQNLLEQIISQSQPQTSHHQQSQPQQQQPQHATPTGSAQTQTVASLLQQLQQLQQQQSQQGGAQNTDQLSLSELQRLLQEKEQQERLQNLQTALLKQQLEALQRQSGSQQQQGGTSQQSPKSGSQPLNGAQPSAWQVFSNTFSRAGEPPGSSSHSTVHSPINQVPNPFSNTTSPAGSLGQASGPSMAAAAAAAAAQGSSAMNQYGLITPIHSGAFTASGPGAGQFVSPLHIPNSGAASVPGMHGYDPNKGGFTPLESPAITPASVFSNASGISNATTSADFFSPLTSPALRPTIDGSAMFARPRPGPPGASPHFGPVGGPYSTTPTASPLALMAQGSSSKQSIGPDGQPIKKKSVPRKNRSTTAEARANKMRPSPLVKPTVPPPSAARARGRDDGDGHSHSRSSSQQNAHASTSSANTPNVNAFAGPGQSRRLDASPSEGAASTPSPIDLSGSMMAPPSNGASGKILTPGSIMGIGADGTEAAGSAAKRTSSSLANGAGSNGKGKKKSGEKGVSFKDDAGDNAMEDDEAPSSAAANGAAGPDSRRTSHKAAEQKRRDSLKYCFDELRNMLPAITLDDDAPGGSYLGPDGREEDIEAEGFDPAEVGDAESARIANRAISKVALLRHSNEYLIRIKARLERRDAALEMARRENMELRSRLGLPILPLPGSAAQAAAAQAAAQAAAAMMGQPMPHHHAAQLHHHHMVQQQHHHQHHHAHMQQQHHQPMDHHMDMS